MRLTDTEFLKETQSEIDPMKDLTEMCNKELSDLNTPEADVELERRVIEEQKRLYSHITPELVALYLTRMFRPEHSDVFSRAIRDEIIRRHKFGPKTVE